MGLLVSNSAVVIDVCVLWVVCCQRSLRRADHSSRGVLPSVVCCVITKPRKMGRLRPPRGFGAIEEEKVNFTLCRAMAQAVSRRPLIAEARVRSRVSPCEICGGQIGTGTGFSPSCHFSPVNFIPLVLH
jgi:hypothetical protein